MSTQEMRDALAEQALDKKMAKLKKKLSESQVEDFEAMSVEDMKARIVSCETAIHETEQAQAADEELAEQKAKVAEMGASYRETKAAQKVIASFLVCLLDKAGKV